MKEKFVIQLILPLSLNIFGVFVNFFKVTNINIILIGTLAFAGNISGFFTFLLDLGITQIHYQYSSKQDYYRYFGSYFIIKAVLIAGNYFLPVFVFIGFKIENPIIMQLIWLNLATGIVYAISEIFVVNLRVRLKILKVEIPNFLIQTVNQLFQLYVILNPLQFDNPAISITVINLIANIIRVGAFLFLNIGESINLKPKLDLIKKYLADSKSLILQNLLTIPTMYLGAVLLGLSSGLQDLAYYQLTFTYIIIILLSLATSITPIFDALFPKMFADNDTGSIQAVINRVEKYFSILYLFFVVFILLYSELLFGYFFPSYLPAVKYLKWLIPIPFLDSILLPYFGNLIQAKKQSLYARISIFNNIVNLFLQIILVPNMILNVPMAGLGIWGIIIIQWIFAIENNLIFRYCSKKLLNLSSSVKYWKHFLNSVFSFALIFGLNQILPIFINNPLYFFFVSFCAFVITYFAIFYLSREFSMQEIKFFRSLMKPSNYLKTLKDELTVANKQDSSSMERPLQ